MALDCLKSHPTESSARFRQLRVVPTPLTQQLRDYYGDRWDVLVDALFATTPAQRASLLNPFMHHKEACELSEQELLLAQHRGAGSLTRASLKRGKGGFPLLVVMKHEELLQFRSISLYQLVDQVPEAFYRNVSSGLLNQFWCYPAALLPVVFANPQPESNVLVLGSPPSSRLLGLCYLLFGSSEVAAGEQSSSTERAHEPAPRVALPWSVYGQGKPPERWQAHDEILGPDGEPMSQAQQSWGLQKFLEGMLARSVRAGCCTVRTTSGDWAELADQVAQSQNAAPTSPMRSQSRRLSGIPDTVADRPLTIRHCSSDFPSTAGRLFENHLPEHVLQAIRIEHADSRHLFIPRSDALGNKDLVIVEAPSAADESAVRSACRQGEKGAWPSKEAQGTMAEQRALFLAGFQELRIGGKLLYCSSSLARQETDDVIIDCSSSLLRSIRVLGPADLEEFQLGRELLVTAKKFGLEHVQYGWRMLPDLAFQKPQYFSILERIA